MTLDSPAVPLPAPFPAPAPDSVVQVVAPAVPSVPLVFASPHSGDRYPPALVAASRLDARALRRSEDAFVDALFADVPGLGAPLVRALFPRVWVDVNREAFELDPAMFTGPLPDWVDTASPRAAAGIGTVARVVTGGQAVYGTPLDFDEVHARIEAHWTPYHETLRRVVDETRRRFGVCILIDCHSMPSVGGAGDRDRGRHRVDIVLGDRHGTACAPRVFDVARHALIAAGLVVTGNTPYAGGYTTGHYGRPGEGVHALQVEINRALYMDEATLVPTAGFEPLRRKLSRLFAALSVLDAEALRRG